MVEFKVVLDPPPRAFSITRFMVSMSRTGGPPGLRGGQEVVVVLVVSVVVEAEGTVDSVEPLNSPFSKFSRYRFLGGLGVEFEFEFEFELIIELQLELEEFAG